jgi:hypothetical protein
LGFGGTSLEKIIFFLGLLFVDNYIDFWAAFVIISSWAVLRLIFSVSNGHEKFFGLVEAISILVEVWVLADKRFDLSNGASYRWYLWYFIRLAYSCIIDDTAYVIVSCKNLFYIKLFHRYQRIKAVSRLIVTQAQLSMSVFAPYPSLLFICDRIIVFISQNQVNKGRT